MPRNKIGQAFTLLEAIILVLVLSIVGVAAGVGLQSVAKLPAKVDSTLAIDNEALSRLEQIKAAHWSTMASVATALTNVNPGICIAGQYYPCIVTVTQADPDGSGVQTDYRELSVQIDTHIVTTRVMQTSASVNP